MTFAASMTPITAEGKILISDNETGKIEEMITFDINIGSDDF